MGYKEGERMKGGRWLPFPSSTTVLIFFKVLVKKTVIREESLQEFKIFNFLQSRYLCSSPH